MVNSSEPLLGYLTYDQLAEIAEEQDYTIDPETATAEEVYAMFKELNAKFE